ncbi:hypothetical protein DBR00_12545 [Pseudomonas sp. HMWF032]|uniref:DUF4136 domain-containing protein n=1 Tax=unclassified Pseudomonas TaxID=196821 RepID=UPI000D337837|nr:MULTISPECIES: DUF4136 domain-containing protein [unclassified Pseudomonas]PTS83817.1 hypothetical protein DBR00_12545 [Pseudomonas sp. HMWF032]PTT82199.1 hypothetical protein DBR41_14800 [Pseudomonas sp. HMWF010]WAC46612.1 DUF4136 domain-containing protein [Pseudomonas sp. SL4(2022)]
MRLFIVLLLCLALATCSNQLPRAQVLTPASQALTGKHRFSLIAAEQAVQGQVPFAERYEQLEQLLREGLSNRGYQASPQAQIQVYYWLAVQDSPLDFKTDAAPPTLLGPYQAIHRLRDETGTLRLRLTTPNQDILWEGLISTGLSPARDSAELLERATQALLQQIPRARP